MALSIGAGVAFGTGSSGSISVGTGPAVYTTSRSLRWRNSASAYLNRTPASATNRQTWTYSAWVKLTPYNPAVGGYDSWLLTTKFNGVAPTATTISINTNYKLVFASYDGSGGSPSLNLVTTQVFRDYSSWYHIVVVADTTQATAANRAKLYVNGVQITSFSTATYPAQNYNTYVNNNDVTALGALYYSGGGAYSYLQFLDSYMAEMNFIDGQALTPSSFGAISSTTGVWQPIAYTGTYGTNGFYLPFSDNSALTTSSNVGLGKDFSGNGNYWITNNISITAGVTYDSMTDVPTLTSATAANFAVVSPIDISSVGATISNGNLKFSNSSGGSQSTARATIGVSSGKWYWETTCTTFGGSNPDTGILGTNSSLSSADQYVGNYALGYSYGGNGQKRNNNSGSAYGATYTSGDVIGVALDMTAGTLTFYKNNSSQGTAFTGLSGTFSPAISGYNGVVWDTNFGQQPFTYTPPAGYVALNAYNLPAPTVSQGNTVMDATLYTGTSARLNVVNAAPFYTDFVWIKCRSAAQDHNLYDSVRGVNNYLTSDTTAAAVAVTQGLLAFTPSGFTVGTGSDAAVNTLGQTYVAWQWQRSVPAGFDIVTFTGNGGSQTFAHGLGAAPGLMICKSRNNAQDWYVYHSSIGGTAGLTLNTTAASVTSVNYWANVTPGTGTFSVGPNFSNTYTYVNYLFAPIAGYSAFGSYTGNGSTDGPFVYTGFRPKFVLTKCAGTTGNWTIEDSNRTSYNLQAATLYPNLSNAEDAGNGIDLLSNGFKLRNADASNQSGQLTIYAAFAENPFKYAVAR